MDALSHYRHAELLLRKADLSEINADDYDPAPTLATMALAHAVLALVGVTALGGYAGMPLADGDAWCHVVSVSAPIPPETDDADEGDASR